MPCRFLFPCPAGATVRPLEAGCLLAAMPLRDSSCPVGAVPPYGWVPCGGTDFPFVGKWGVFTLQLVFACPAGAKTTFSFAQQKKKRFWTPKKKRQTGGNDYGLRYNRAKPQSCLGIPWVKSFGLSFCFRRLAFERPVAPLAPLPLSGWNTVHVRWYPRRLGGWQQPVGELPLKLCRQRRVNFNGISSVFHQRTHGCGARGTMGA